MFNNESKEVTTLDEMMVAIKRNVKPSECIKNFEGLLREIKDERITDIFIREMHGFLTDLFKLFHEIDKLNSKELKARMLTKEFIMPENYFKNSKKLADKIMKYRAAYEFLEKCFTAHTKTTDKTPVKIKYKEAAELVNDKTWAETEDDMKELARKVMLLYNHIPAVYKALIQTKRRKLGLDCNSKKFKE
jgi:hypothetical protein